MKIELDIKGLKKAVRETRSQMKDLKYENKMLTDKFIKKAKENLEYISRTAIDQFYEDYEPNMYAREYELYNAYRIYVTEDEWRIDFDPSYVGKVHRVDDQDPDYIFENSFIRGWHGGAIDGEGHPEPGVPYWRIPDDVLWLPDRNLPLWSKSSPWTIALKSPSPYKEIVRKSKLYMDLETAKYHKEYNDNIEKFQKTAVRNLERIK